MLFRSTSHSVSAAELSAKLKESGIVTSALGPKFLRLVTHLDFDDQQLEKVLTTLPALLKSSLMSK